MWSGCSFSNRKLLGLKVTFVWASYITTLLTMDNWPFFPCTISLWLHLNPGFLHSQPRLKGNCCHWRVRINNSTIWWWFYAKQRNQDKARALPQSRLHRSPPWKQMNKLLPQCTLVFSSAIYAFLISPNIGLNGSALPQNGRLDHVL